MRQRGVILTLILTAVWITGARPALADGIPAKAWKTFVAESSSQYGDADPADFEDQLYLAATKNKSQAAAIADFAKRMKLSPEQAQAYAALIVDATVFSATCEGECPFGPGTPLFDEAAAVASQAPDGRLLLWLGKQVDNGPGFIRLAWNHRKAAWVFSALYSYNEHSSYLAALLLKLPDDPSAVPLPLLKGAGFSGAPDEMSGLIPAIIESTEARLAATPGTVAWRAAIAQFALEQQLDLGLDHDAMTRYLAYPEAVRALLPYVPVGLSGNDICRQSDASRSFAAHMAAALWRENRDAEALALLNHAYPADWPGRRNDVEYIERLKDARTPTIADNDLFKLYIEGRPQPPEATGKPAQGDCGDYRGINGEGWLFATAGDTPAVRHLVASRLYAAGYKDMAAWLTSQKVFNDWNRDPAVFAQLSDLMPADVVTRQPAWAQRIKDLRAADDRAESTTAAMVHVVRTELATMWSEKPLPPGLKAWGENEQPRALPKGLSLPVPADSILRYEGEKGEAAVVYMSSQYDLPGEVPAYGLWLALQRGGTWQAPLYLGLQQYFPYVATMGSRLPLIDGDRLHLEVQVREIDKATITFPPVALGYTRQADGLYLDIALSDLKADRDVDGLTDIEEARLGLKPDNDDSDGDGLRDGDDALPLTAYDAKADLRTGRVAQAILEHIVGHDAGAIVLKPRTGENSDPLAGALGGSAPSAARNTVFLASDTDIFSGIAGAPFRLIVYSSEDLKRLDRGGAPFFPPRIINIFRSLDGADTYVNWSASWVGGSFVIHCEGETCTSKVLSDWIT